MKNKLRPFHLAFPVFDIEETIKWYTKNFSCSIGRKDTRWVDFNFFGHQISAHLVDKNDNKEVFNQVDNEDIPVRHFGIILTYNQWEIISKQLIHNGIKFIIKPQTRFKGEIGEQSTMFVKDPSGNVIEFKAFKDDNKIFET